MVWEERRRYEYERTERGVKGEKEFGWWVIGGLEREEAGWRCALAPD